MAEEIRRLRKQVASGAKLEQVGIDKLLAGAEHVGDVKLVAREIPDGTPQTFRDLVDQLRRKSAPVAVLLAARQEEGKVLLVAGLSRDLVERGGDAVKWVRQVAKLVHGGGGGRPDLAQAGGKDADRLPEALATARESLEALLK
jgi:alanyl-tRNA synthetase